MKKQIIIFLIFIVISLAHGMEGENIQLYELILPWTGKMEEVKKGMEEAKNLHKEKEIINDVTGEKIILKPNTEEVIFCTKGIPRVVTYYFFLNTIDDTIAESTPLFGTKLSSKAPKKRSRCLIN